MFLGSAAALPVAAVAQRLGRTYRLGFLSQGGRQRPQILAFFDELRLHGFIEGQNLIVIPDGFDIPVEQLPARVAAIVEAAPDVLFGVGEVVTRALKAATRIIPI